MEAAWVTAAWVTEWVGGRPEKMVGMGKGIAASILSASWRITGQALQNPEARSTDFQRHHHPHHPVGFVD